MPLPILLVSCYELGHQPLGVAWAAGFLERAGFEPQGLDLAVETVDDRVLRAAKLIVVSVPMHTAVRLAVRFAARVRAIAPDAHLCFAGHYARLDADRLLGRDPRPAQGTRPIADSVVSGEAEDAIVALARALDEGRAPHWTAGVETRVTRGAPVFSRLPFAAPARRALPVLDRYAKLDDGGERRLAAAIESTRGCLHRCRHCPIPPVYDGRFFVVPLEVVLEDISAVVDAGARHVTFADPDFLNGPAHARRVVDSVHALFPEITFDVTAKVEHLLKHRDLIPVLARSGCRFVVSAVESLSDRVLAVLDKGHTAADVKEALALCRAAGLAMRPSLLPFTPWSSFEDYRGLLEWIHTEDLADHVDPVQLTIRLLVPPGSLLQSHPAFLPHRGRLDAERFSWTWTHPDPRMDELQRTVTRIAEEGATNGAAPEDTLAAIAHAAGVAHRARATDAAARRPRAPRLTEPWFC